MLYYLPRTDIERDFHRVGARIIARHMGATIYRTKNRIFWFRTAHMLNMGPFADVASAKLDILMKISADCVKAYVDKHG